MIGKLTTFFSLVLAVFFLGGCDVNPSEFGEDEAKAFVSKVAYTKDKRTGLCFALIASRKTMSANQSGMGMSVVPCDKVELLLK